MAIVERGEKCVLINDSGDMINTELSNEGELKISNGTLFSLTIDFDAWLEDGSDPLRLKEFIICMMFLGANQEAVMRTKNCNSLSLL